MICAFELPHRAGVKRPKARCVRAKKHQATDGLEKHGQPWRSRLAPVIDGGVVTLERKVDLAFRTMASCGELNGGMVRVVEVGEIRYILKVRAGPCGPLLSHPSLALTSSAFGGHHLTSQLSIACSCCTILPPREDGGCFLRLGLLLPSPTAHESARDLRTLLTNSIKGTIKGNSSLDIPHFVGPISMSRKHSHPATWNHAGADEAVIAITG